MAANIQTAKIFIQDPVHADSIGDIYVENDPAQLAKNGCLFVLININNPENDYDKFIGAFLEKIHHFYYSSVLEDSTKILEYSLNEINQWLPQNLPHNKKILQNLNIGIGNIKDNIINISLLGQWQGYLLHPLKAIDVVGKDNGPINPVKIFANVITGQLQPGFAFLLTNDSLLDYLSLDKVRKIITTIPALSAAAQFQNMVAEVSDHVSFLSVIIKNSVAEEEYRSTPDITPMEPINRPHDNATTVKSKASLDQLIVTQKQTQQIMTVPSSWQAFTSTLSNLKDAFSQSNIMPLLIRFFHWLGKKIWWLLRNLGIGLLWIALQLKNIIVNLIHPDNIHRRRAWSWQWLKHINLKQKLVATGLIAAAIIIIVIILLSKGPQGLTEEQFTTINNEFTNKSENIEAALIYGDRLRAQTLLDDLIILRDQFPVTDKNYQNAIDGWRQQLNILTERIWNIMDIAEPVAIISSDQLNQTISWQKVMAQEDNIYLFTNGNDWVNYNFTQKEFSTTPYPANMQKIKFTTIAPDDSIIIFDQNNNIFQVNNDALQPMPISYSAGLKNVSSATSFFNRLYVLDNETDQVYRHRLVGNAFQSPDLWLKDNIDLTDAKDLAIDGNIYILQNNKIIKLSAGRQIDFPAINIYPPLNNPSQLFTSPESANIYLLDPENNRLIVLDKNGKLIKQYHSDKFIDLQAMSIQEDQQRAFLITPHTLFVIPL
ncbi:MAG: hypothetical protein ACKKL5_01750 [Candidatus Komeilibacteria bacterium]